MIKYNLQFFAESSGGEKTEPATEKKKSDARKEGQVAKSKEIENAFSLMALFLLLKLWTGSLAGNIINFFHLCYDDIGEYIKNYDGYVNETDIINLVLQCVLQLIILLAPVLIVAFIVSFVCDVAQVGWKPTAKPLQPKASKINPISGFKKIFSKTAVVELLKAILKIVIILTVTWSYLKKNINGLFLLYDVSLYQGIGDTCKLVVDLGIRIAAAYLIIAFADYGFQRWKYNDDLKMTKQEVKDEYKQQEGDPQIKGKIRQKMREASQRRMMQNLPKADVVITNPTHYAVALLYDSEKYPAPIVVAKGADF
ncbi:MAG: EscU/YscU/HrcU family type III secretion system export apparatus switch protein, partial [Lachnospiraceae bacterium]|nr:EscU/YscU/HrcU family type III secretion system export apparatus switch protein [Lachnospiraceae bacterium]